MEARKRLRRLLQRFAVPSGEPETAARNRRHARRRHDWAVPVAAALALVCFGVFAWLATTASRNAKQTARQLLVEERLVRTQQQQLGSQYLFLIESCARLNIVRAEDNASHYADYEIDSVVYKLTKARVPQQTPEQRRATAQFLAPLVRALKIKTWTPLTDCRRAVNRNGARYRPPAPVPFIDKRNHVHLPPQSAMMPPAEP